MTSETKTRHTEGPWEYDNTGGPISIHASDGQMIAGLCFIGKEGRETPNSLANARLISAAPEMLEALEEVLGALNHGTENPHWEHIDRIRAILAKAKGE